MLLQGEEVMGVPTYYGQLQRRDAEERNERLQDVRVTCTHEETIGEGYNKICKRCYLPVR